MSHESPAILVTGANGYVGGRLAAALLAKRAERVVLPIRPKHDTAGLHAAILAEARELAGEAAEIDPERLVVVPLPNTADVGRLVAEFESVARGLRVTEIVHSAGSLSYFNVDKLVEGNQRFTEAFLELGRRIGVRRFVYISTAFASGYVEGPIAEAIHAEEAIDPNEYTRSKRATERLVAASGLPYLILRPSIVVGRSSDGHYRGRPYGAYQVWTGLCRFLCDQYRPVIHAVAPDLPLNFIHEDAMQAGFLAALEHLPDGAVVHLVSRDAVVPTTREYWHLWMTTCGRPREVRYYDDLTALPREELDEGQRLVIDFAEANIEISSHAWQFQTDHLDRLRAAGRLDFSAAGGRLDFRDATVSTMETCLHWFLARNFRAKTFMQANAGPSAPPEIVRVAKARL